MRTGNETMVVWAGHSRYETRMPDTALDGMNHALREFSKEVSKRCCQKRCETAGWLIEEYGEASPVTCFQYRPLGRYGCEAYKHDDINEGLDRLLASIEKAKREMSDAS